MIKITTIEVDAEGNTSEHRRGARENLAAAVNAVEYIGWLPGNISGTGLTIMETRFESVEESL